MRVEVRVEVEMDPDQREYAVTLECDGNVSIRKMVELAGNAVTTLETLQDRS